MLALRSPWLRDIVRSPEPGNGGSRLLRMVEQFVWQTVQTIDGALNEWV